MAAALPSQADLVAMLPSIAVLVAFIAVAGCCLYISYRVGQTVSPASRALQQRFAELETAVGRSEKDLRQALERHREANAKEARRLLDEGVRGAETQAQQVRKGLDDFGERLNGARLDFSRDATRVREEVQGAVAGLQASTREETRELGRQQGETLASISGQIAAQAAEGERRQERVMATLDAIGSDLKAIYTASAGELRERVAADLVETRATLAKLAETITTHGAQVTGIVAGQGAEVAQAIAGQRTQLDGMDTTIRAALRESAGSQAALSAAIEGKQVALNAAITGKQDALAATIASKHDLLGASMRGMQDALGVSLQEKQDALNGAVASQFAKFRDEASAQLAQLLAVDERLESSWGHLKGDFDAITRSLVQISRAIEALKNELTVKLDDGGRSSGVDGLLGRVLQPSEYERDVEIEPGSNQRVSFAVKLSDNPVTRVWLPIGTLPVVRGYNELVAATVYSDTDAIRSSSETFERSILAAAEDFSAKFVCPPRTPNLAVLVAPNDDLFDEIARRDSLVDSVGRNFHVLIAGPATLPTLLAALRMAFRGTSGGRSASPPNGPRAQLAITEDLEPRSHS